MCIKATGRIPSTRNNNKNTLIEQLMVELYKKSPDNDTNDLNGSLSTNNINTPEALQSTLSDIRKEGDLQLECNYVKSSELHDNNVNEIKYPTPLYPSC